MSIFFTFGVFCKKAGFLAPEWGRARKNRSRSGLNFNIARILILRAREGSMGRSGAARGEGKRRRGCAGSEKFFFAQSWLCGARTRAQNFFKISLEILRFRPEGFVALQWEELLAPRAEMRVALRWEICCAVRGSLLHCAESFRAFCPLMRLPALMRSSAVFPAARIFLKIALVKIVQLYPCGFLQPAWLFLPLSAERRAFRRGFKASEGAPALARKAGCLAAFRGACACPKFS